MDNTSGDIIGNYKFIEPPKENDLLIFGDMALYTSCKNNTFNGMPLPDIYILHLDNTFEKLTNFGYRDFKYRLGKEKTTWTSYFVLTGMERMGRG